MSEIKYELSGLLAAEVDTYARALDERDEARAQRDEALDRLEVAHRIAASLEAEVAKVRELHKRIEDPFGGFYCSGCTDAFGFDVLWPCRTAEAVYL